MKKLNILYLLAIIAAVLGACSSESNNSEKEKEEQKNNIEGVHKKAESKGDQKIGSDATDFATFFNESLVDKDSDVIEEAVDAIIHPEKGVFLLHRPGAINKPEYCEGVEDIKAVRESIVDDFTNIQAKVKKGNLPFYDCISFDKEGSYFKRHGNDGIVEKAYKDMADMMYVEVPEEKYEKAREADEAIEITVVSTNAAFQLGFGKIDEKWYLILVDIAAFDCGA